jgi:hypothetical protein
MKEGRTNKRQKKVDTKEKEKADLLYRSQEEKTIADLKLKNKNMLE